jgi:hypothetical protein
MAGKKGENIKIVLVIALSLVLVISFYFRFIHAKVKEKEVLMNGPSAAKRDINNRTKGRGGKVLSAHGGLNIPKMNIAPLQEIQDLKPAVNGNVQTVIRDIFMPLVSASRTSNVIDAQSGPEPSMPKPPPSYKLRGTIVGKKSSMAIIDDQFLRQGDWIGEFQVAAIGKKEVLLDSGKQKIILEILKNE